MFGEQSDLSTPALRQEKIELTGTGVGGNGGIHQQRVKHVTLPTGHFVPVERVSDCADVTA